MAQGQLRSFLSLVALICLIGGTFATALGLIKIGENPTGQMVTDEEYIVPAAVGNTLCVIFLIWLTATIPTRSTAYKFVVILFLIFGLIGEIYLTFFFTEPPAVYGTYVLVVVNFLIRTFYVLEYVQDTWSPVSWTDYQGAPKPSSSNGPAKPAGESKPSSEKKPEMDDKTKEIRKKIGEAVTKMRADTKKFDGSTQDKAYKAFNAAIASGKTADDAYRAAKGELKYEDGSAYTGAGRRRA
jgi:hypothetical protein